MTGVTVDQAGRPVAVLRWCSEEPPDGIVLYPEQPETSSPPEQAPTWEFELRSDWRPPNYYAEVSLYSPPERWSTSGSALGELTPRQVYVLEGDYDDVRQYFRPVEVTVARLARIRPGTVVTQKYDPRTRKQTDLYQTRAEFRNWPTGMTCS